MQQVIFPACTASQSSDERGYYPYLGTAVCGKGQGLLEETHQLHSAISLSGLRLLYTELILIPIANTHYCVGNRKLCLEAIVTYSACAIYRLTPWIYNQSVKENNSRLTGTKMSPIKTAPPVRPWKLSPRAVTYSHHWG